MNQGVYVLLREKMREQDEKYGPFASTQEALGDPSLRRRSSK